MRILLVLFKRILVLVFMFMIRMRFLDLFGVLDNVIVVVFVFMWFVI